MTPEIKQRIQQIRHGKVPKGYKKTKEGMIPKEWMMCRISEFCSMKSGNTITSASICEIEEYPCYGGNGLRGYTNKYTHNGKYVLVGRQGALCGNVQLVNGKFYASEHAIVVTSFDNCYVEFVFYLFSYMNLNKYSESSAQPGLSVEKLLRLYSIIPPLPEQTAIAEILSTQDRVIELKEQLLAEKKRQKKYLMQQLLTGKKRLKGFKGEWRKCRLGEIFSERNETNCIDLPLLSITGDKGVIPQSDSEKRDTSNDDKSKYKRICPNDIGYNTMRMWQGRSALSKIEGIVSPAYTIVVPKYNIDAHYMSELLHQPDVVYKFWTHSQGLVSDTLTCKYNDFCKVWVRIPPLPEQTAIAEILSTADREIELVGQSIEAEKQKKKSLMQLLLTGIVRVDGV